MIRLGKHEDINQIETLVSEAKDLMKSFGNNQWDDKYPATEHFKEDIDTETLYVFIICIEWCASIEWMIVNFCFSYFLETKFLE